MTIDDVRARDLVERFQKRDPYQAYHRQDETVWIAGSKAAEPSIAGDVDMPRA